MYGCCAVENGPDGCCTAKGGPYGSTVEGRPLGCWKAEDGPKDGAVEGGPYGCCTVEDGPNDGTVEEGPDDSTAQGPNDSRVEGGNERRAERSTEVAGEAIILGAGGDHGRPPHDRDPSAGRKKSDLRHSLAGMRWAGLTTSIQLSSSRRDCTSPEARSVFLWRRPWNTFQLGASWLGGKERRERKERGARVLSGKGGERPEGREDTREYPRLVGRPSFTYLPEVMASTSSMARSHGCQCGRCSMRVTGVYDNTAVSRLLVATTRTVFVEFSALSRALRAMLVDARRYCPPPNPLHLALSRGRYVPGGGVSSVLNRGEGWGRSVDICGAYRPSLACAALPEGGYHRVNVKRHAEENASGSVPLNRAFGSQGES